MHNPKIKQMITALIVVLILTSPVWGKEALGIEKTTDTIDRLRIAEDAMWLLASGFIVYLSFFRLRSLLGNMEKTFLLFTVTFLDVFLWKFLGVWRRVWAPPFSDPLHDVGEVFEGLLGILFGITFLYTYMKVKD